MLSNLDWYHYKRNWTLFWDILHALNRRAELRRLIRWADHKALPGPGKAYRQRLQSEECRLARMRLRSQRLLHWSQLTFRLVCLIFPTPRYLVKGPAAGYRSTTSKGRRTPNPSLGPTTTE
jgi:hypothetical protein